MVNQFWLTNDGYLIKKTNKILWLLSLNELNFTLLYNKNEIKQNYSYLYFCCVRMEKNEVNYHMIKKKA